MANILLLYDTKEKDLARDFKDLLDEFNIGTITVISLSPDVGRTLDEKEKRYFDSANGAIFIITPGCERFGSFFPSPSVTHEMGQAKQKFQKRPESVIYIVDETCNIPAIDQKTYIPFNRTDMRSIISALTQLIKDLKTAGLFRTTPIPTQLQPPPKEFNLEAFAQSLNERIKQILFDMSNRMNGFIDDKDLKQLLYAKYSLNVQEINFLLRDLQNSNTVIHNATGAPTFFNSWWLHDLGWAVVRLEIEKKKKLERETMNSLGRMLAAGGGLGGFLGRSSK